MKFKALIVDVDGTLITNHLYSLPSKNVEKAINAASKILHIGVATARPLFAMEEIFSKLQLSGPSIINGGAQVIDVPTRKIIWERYIQKDDISKIFDIANNFMDHFRILDAGTDIVSSENYTPNKPLQIYLPALEPEISEKIIQELSKIPSIISYPVRSWTKGKVDIVINHAEATKQHGIFEVAKILNISTHEIIGVGDGDNDFPLLMACGLKVAMGNAVADLKEIADYVAPTVEKDGVADVINKFILNPS